MLVTCVTGRLEVGGEIMFFFGLYLYANAARSLFAPTHSLTANEMSGNSGTSVGLEATILWWVRNIATAPSLIGLHT
jgi:hypothetical protein